MAFQIVGSALAAAAVKFLRAGEVIPAANPPVLASLLAEFLFTFALVYVVLNVATARARPVIPSTVSPSA